MDRYPSRRMAAHHTAEEALTGIAASDEEEGDAGNSANVAAADVSAAAMAVAAAGVLAMDRG